MRAPAPPPEPLLEPPAPPPPTTNTSHVIFIGTLIVYKVCPVPDPPVSVVYVNTKVLTVPSSFVIINGCGDDVVVTGEILL